MDAVIEELVVSVRGDTQTFARDVETMRSSLDSALGSGFDRAGRTLEAGLMRAVRNGSLGFEDLRKVALSVIDDIAAAALSSGLNSIGLGAGTGGLSGVLGGLLGSVLGLPGRATGGPVAPGRAYRVGEQGPELFIPTSSGRIDNGRATPTQPRDMRVAITVNAQDGQSAPAALQRSSRQVARALGHAVRRAER
ncbi:tail tape measure protein [Alterisphingorhabdus coralli]|uniref:Tail tape measure protein n=1 Tax=Alterisphingorhabdus coralli TaxID=3071408 RepID=A0AA97F7A5_9SPHN|nr:tail tape measure protein [Parasphingorhabdus sp. SCSIO 66989]WOE75684.1 tail tape measure protein [Parasphingorhabdus sp. SCSIO 66989]